MDRLSDNFLGRDHHGLRDGDLAFAGPRKVRWHLAALWVVLSIALVILIGCIAYSVYLVRFEPAVLSYMNQPFKLPKATYALGEAVVYDVQRCNTSGEKRTYFSSITFEPEDSRLPSIRMNGSPIDLPAGCPQPVTKSSLVSVPPSAVVGERYRVAGTATISGTIGVDKLVPWRTEYLTVTE